MSFYVKPYKEQDITKDELACIYSALILADDDIPVTEEKIRTILNAANVNVEAIWPSLFARALSGVNVKEFITNIAGAVTEGGSPAGATSAKVTQETNDEEKKQETKVEEPEDDSDEDFGLSLFD